MADVFISYASSDRALAQGLADDVICDGRSVWWDTSLTPNQRFRAAIDEQLAAAKAVVVIWTPVSIHSDWVISEADDARRAAKLVNTLANGAVPENLPKPFGQVHAVPLTDRKVILEAVGKLSLGKSRPTPFRIYFNADEQFLDEAATRIRERSEHLLSLTRQAEWPNLQEHALQLITSLELLQESIDIYLGRLPLTEIKAFHLRLWSKRLEEACGAAEVQLKKEKFWLENRLSDAVVRGAHGDLGWAAQRLLDAMHVGRREYCRPT